METRHGPVATPAKANLDLCYVAVARRSRPRGLPELDMPGLNAVEQFAPWLSNIANPRVRSIAQDGLRSAISRSRAR